MLQVAENGDLRFTASRAQIIDELETTIPAWLRRRNPHWYPKFVHILTVSDLLFQYSMLDNMNVSVMSQQGMPACHCLKIAFNIRIKPGLPSKDITMLKHMPTHVMVHDFACSPPISSAGCNSTQLPCCKASKLQSCNHSVMSQHGMSS